MFTHCGLLGNFSSTNVVSILDGNVYQWGQHFVAPNQVFDPPTILSSIKYINISSSIGIKSDNSLWSWGSNYYGQLGNGTGNIAVPATAPVNVLPGTTWNSISSNTTNVIGIKADGSLWGWGRNDYGQVGDNTILNKSTPVNIMSGTSWTSISAGIYHTLGIKADGSLWGWGRNDYGQIGDNTITNKSTPVNIIPGTTWLKVAAGGYHSIGIKADGSLWGWGINGHGEVGDGTTFHRSTPVSISPLVGHMWKEVAVGGASSLAIDQDNKIWGWGWNQYGQLGMGYISLGASDYVSNPSRLNDVNNTSFVKIYMDEWGASVGIKSDGSMWGWGNSFGSGVLFPTIILSGVTCIAVGINDHTVLVH